MTEGQIHRLEPKIYYFTFGPNEPAALTIRSGDHVVTKTRDAGGSNEKMEPIPEIQKQKSDITTQ